MTAHDGTAREPAAPPAQSPKLSLIVKGTGTIPTVDPQCVTDPAGQFEARYVGTAEISSDQAYVAAISKTTAKIVTPSGCEIPDLTVGVITDIIVRAELTINTQNCESYCQASARADAEAQCGATASAAECRATAETESQASCTTTCTTQSDTIVSEVSLGAGALGDLDASALRAAAFGEINADLEFDHLE